jgi:hypothetical protein
MDCAESMCLPGLAEGLLTVVYDVVRPGRGQAGLSAPLAVLAVFAVGTP